VVLPFAHRDAARALLGQELQTCGKAPRAVGEREALCKALYVCRSRHAVRLGVIDLRDVVARGDDAVDVVAVVREDEKPCRVLVESAGGDELQALQIAGCDASSIAEEVPYIGVLLKKNQDIDTVSADRRYRR
jgi:hypothetical protein